MSLIAIYPRKPYADFTVADRRAERRYTQGQSHGRQGRMDLLGQCKHYDRGHRDCSAVINPELASTE